MSLIYSTLYLFWFHFQIWSSSFYLYFFKLYKLKILGTNRRVLGRLRLFKWLPVHIFERKLGRSWQPWGHICWIWLFLMVGFLIKTFFLCLFHRQKIYIRILRLLLHKSHTLLRSKYILIFLYFLLFEQVFRMLVYKNWVLSIHYNLSVSHNL